MARLAEDWAGHFALEDEALVRVFSRKPRPIRELGLNKSPVVLSREDALAYGYQPGSDALAI